MCSSRDCHSSAGVRLRHGWSTASMGRHDKVERARRYSATLGIVWRCCRAPEAGASSQTRLRALRSHRWRSHALFA